MTELTADDEGKTVVTADGDTVGMITGIDGDRAHVDPDAGVTDQIKSMLGWEDPDQDDYTLGASRIDDVTEDEVRLSR